MTALLFFFPGWNSRINSTWGLASSSSPSPLSIFGKGRLMSESQAGRTPRAALLPARLHSDCLSLLPAGRDPWIPGCAFVSPCNPCPAVTHLGSAGLPWVSLPQALCITYRLVPIHSHGTSLASWPPDRQPCSTPAGEPTCTATWGYGALRMQGVPLQPGSSWSDLGGGWQSVLS